MGVFEFGQGIPKMKSPTTLGLVLAVLLTLGLISWRYSAANQPAHARMRPISSAGEPKAGLSKQPTGTAPSLENSESFAKSLPRLAPSGAGELASRATELVKRMDVATLDPDLPSQHFEEWFRETMGPEQSITWELNECGEATGNPQVDRQRDMPICVEARAQS